MPACVDSRNKTTVSVIFSLVNKLTNDVIFYYIPQLNEDIKVLFLG